MWKVKKIIGLQKRLDTKELSDKQKKKIKKKISKLSEGFLYVGSEELETEPKKLHMFITGWGRQILVEDYKIVFKSEPKYPTSPLIPYLLAFAILLILYLTATVLNLFGIISDGLLLSFSFVMSSAGFLLNLWTIYDCRKIMKQYKFLLVVNVLALLLNGFNVYNDIVQMIG